MKITEVCEVLFSLTANIQLKPSAGVRNTIALSVKAIPQFTQILNKLYQDFQVLRASDEDATAEQSPKENNTEDSKNKEVPPPKKEEKNGNPSTQQKVEGAKEEA